MRNTFVQKLIELAENQKNIMLLTGDLGYGVFDEFEKKFPNQFINCGVAEQNMIGVAAGLASEGKKVFVYSIANFSTFRCLEQIRNDICYHNFPVTIVSVGAGFSYGTLGYSHYAIEDISIIRSLPGMRILSPVDPSSVKKSLDLIVNSASPTYLRLGKNEELNLKVTPENDIENLNVNILGKDNLIISTGSISSEVEKAVNLILNQKDEGICFATLNQLKPLNLNLIFLNKFKKIITIEEHTLSGGFGSIINDFIIKNELNIKVLNIGIEEKLHHLIGSMEYMRKINGLDLESLIEKIINFIKKVD
jgi:transketolase